MGCMTSKPAEPVRAQELAPTGGGSIILSKATIEPEPAPSSADVPTSGAGSLVVTKGGSYVIGRKYAGAWEPGENIARPDNTMETHHYYLPVNATTVLRLSWAAISEQGRSPRPPHKPNQDSWCALEGVGNDPSVALFAVFDGHGPKGEDASNFCRINVPDHVVRSAAFARSPFDALRGSFEATHRRFISPETQRVGVDTTVSGSTAIAVMIHGNTFMCANVGDSRAMMGSVLPGASGGRAGTVLARPLSRDHKPNRPDEQARIKKATGRILSERALGIEGGDPSKLYVCRVHAGTIRYGVLFTRSIGDADGHAYLGLTATPEMTTGNLTERDKFIVLASDGVWDYLDEDAVARMVSEACTGSGADGGSGDDDAQTATLNIVQNAKACWERESHGGRRDDITVVTVLMRLMPREQAEAEQRARGGAAAGGSVAGASASTPTAAAATTSAAAGGLVATGGAGASPMPLLSGRDDAVVAAESAVAEVVASDRDASAVVGSGAAVAAAVAGGSGASDPADATSSVGSSSSSSDGVPVLRPSVARVESEGVAVEGSGRILPAAAAASDAAAAAAPSSGSA